MTRFQCDHIHLRSPEPEETARFYERMFGAKIIRTVQEGRERIDLDLGGQAIVIAPVLPDGKTAAPPRSPYQGLDHIGLTVIARKSVVYGKSVCVRLAHGSLRVTENMQRTKVSRRQLTN